MNWADILADLSLNWIDFSIITLILLSAIISFFQGFVKELFSFLSWFFSFVIAFLFLDGLASQLTTLIPKYTDLRLGMTFMILFFTSFLILEGINYLILNSIGRTQLSIADRFLGTIFGIARSAVIVILLILFTGLTHLPTKAVWQKSVLIGYLKPIVVELRSHWPLEVATQFNFDPPPELVLPSF